MVDFSSLLPAGLPATPALLPTLLEVLPMRVIYYTPVVDTAGTLTDLALAYLNPAAQRMTQLPAQPGTTYRQQFPTTDENGAWDFHRLAYPGHRLYYDSQLVPHSIRHFAKPFALDRKVENTYMSRYKKGRKTHYQGKPTRWYTQLQVLAAKSDRAALAGATSLGLFGQLDPLV